MAESTNNPSGMGGNPGRPSVNDQGAVQPNFAPNPPSSKFPSPEEQMAGKSFNAFVDKNNELQKTVEKLTASLQQTITQQRELRERLDKSAVAEQEAREREMKARAEAEAQYTKYRDSEGRWMAGAEPLRVKMEEDLRSFGEETEKAAKEVLDTAKALEKSNAEIENERKTRADAIDEMRQFRIHVRDVSYELAEDMGDALRKTMSGFAKFDDQLEDSLQDIAKESDEFLEGVFKERVEAEKTATEALRKANIERAAAAAAVGIGEKRTADVSAFGTSLAMGGGMVGINQIKDQINAVTEAQMASFRAANPDATKEEEEAYREKNITLSKSVVLEKIRTEQEKELLELRRNQVEEIVGQTGMSRGAAVAVAGSGNYSNQEKELKKRHDQVIASLNRLNQPQLSMLAEMKEEQVRAAERDAEAEGDVPEWAQRLIDTYMVGTQELRESLSGLFDQDGAGKWFKTIIFILSVVIGGVVGYIYTYIQKVFNLLSGIAKIFPSLTKIFSAVGGGVGGVFGRIGGAFTAVERSLSGILRGIPFIGRFLAFLPRVMNGLRIGFNLVSKFFLPLNILITVIQGIVGAFRGFGKDGLKGAIIGAVAQIVSGLTFGLLDFEKVFGFINESFGELVDAFLTFGKQVYNNMIKPFVDAFGNIVEIFQGNGNLFSKIIKTVVELLLATGKFLVGRLIMTFVQIPVLLLKAAFYVAKFFYYDIPKMLIDAAVWVYNWITSGEWLNDFLSFGDWLYDKMVTFFSDIINSIADALGELPIVGDYIKKAIGGGTPTPTKPSLTTAKSGSGYTPLMGAPLVPISSPSGGVQFAAMSMPQSFAGSTMSNAATTTSMSQYFANSRMATSVISAPSTVVAAGGGGGGGTTVLSPRTSRNNDPTYRALLFQEAPSL